MKHLEIHRFESFLHKICATFGRGVWCQTRAEPSGGPMDGSGPSLRENIPVPKARTYPHKKMGSPEIIPGSPDESVRQTALFQKQF